MGWMKPVIFALGLMFFWSLLVIVLVVSVRISVSASLKARLPHSAGTLEEAAQTKWAGSVICLFREGVSRRRLIHCSKLQGEVYIPCFQVFFALF